VCGALTLPQFAEVNILRANGKEEEARSLKASVSMLKTQINVLENQVRNRYLLENWLFCILF
jgi:hypothetical protein